MASPSSPFVTIVDGSDWSAVYLDGNLYEEGHLDLEGVKLGLDVASANYNIWKANLEWLREKTRFPVNLTDVVIENPEPALT
jgi:hypothetical protein